MIKNPAEELAFALHSEERAKSNLETHVYMVFQDGEICMTKCGDLLGQRGMHMLEAGVTDAIPSVFPNKMGENTYAYVDSREEATAIRRALQGRNDYALEMLTMALSKKKEENISLKETVRVSLEEKNKAFMSEVDENTRAYLKDLTHSSRFFEALAICEDKFGFSKEKAKSILFALRRERQGNV